MELGKLFTKSIMAFLLFFLMFNQTRANEFLVTPPPCEERDTVDVVICSFSSYTFYGNTYNMPGTYHDTVSGVCDTIHTLILDTTAGTDPTIVISASGNVVCYNDSVVISSTVQFPGSSPTFNWKKNGSAFGSNSPTLTVHYAALNNGDVFSCQMISNDPCTINNPVNSNSITLSKSSLTKPTPSLTGSVINVGTTGAGYQWYKDNVLLTNDTNQTLTVSLYDTACYKAEVIDTFACVVTSWPLCINPLTCLKRDTVVDTICSFSSYTFYGTTYNMPGTYHDTVTGGTCDTIHTLLLDTTTGKDPTVVISGSGTVVCDNDSVVISTTTTFPGTYPSFQWKQNGVVVGGNTSTYTVHHNSLADGDSFSVRMTSTDPCTVNNPVFSNTITLSKSSLIKPTISTSNDTMDVGVNADKYQWYKDNALLTNDTNQILVVSLYDTACYVCNVTDTLGCSIDSWNACIFPLNCTYLDTIRDTICSFSSYTFYGNTYTLPGTYNHVINGTCDTTYTLILDTTAGKDPTVSINGSGPVVCPNDSVVLLTTVTFPGTYPSFQWKKNGVVVGGNTSTFTVYYDSLNNGDSFSVRMTSTDPCTINNPVFSNTINLPKSATCDSCITVYDTITTSVCNGDSILFAGVYYKNTGIYNDTITLGSGCDSVSVLDLTASTSVTPVLSIWSVPNQPICSNESVVFNSVAINEGTTPTYQWKRNGVNVGTGASTYSTNPGDNAYGDTVVCVMTSSEACALPATKTDTVFLIVNNGQLVNLYDSICAGDSILFAGTYYKTAGVYSDTVNASPCDSITNLTITYKSGCNPCTDVNVAVSDSACAGDSVLFAGNYYTVPGIYKDTVGLPSGCDSITTLNFSNTSNLIPTIVVSASQTMPVCNGTIISFSTTISNGGASPTYQWKRNGNNVGTGLSTYSPSGASNSNGDTITCTLTSSLGCASPTTATDTLILQLVNGFTVNIADSICAGDSLLFGGNYLKTAGNYADTVTLGAGCDSITNLTLSIANGFVINITDSICTGDSLLFAGTYYNSSGLYSDTVTLASGCDSVTKLTLTYKSNCNPCTNSFTTVVDSICTGDSVLFGGVYYNTPGTYKDTIVITGGCDSVVTLNLSNTTSVTPSISISASVTTICPNQSVTFNSSIVNGGTNPFYQWKINGANVAANGAVYTSSAGQIGNGDIVTCYLVSSSSCANPDTVYSNSVTIMVGGSTTTSISDTICQNEFYMFNGDSLNTSGTYYDTITNGGGCDSIVQLNLQVFPSPIVVANSDVDTISVGGTVNFYPNGSNATNYLWDFGDSFSSTLNTVSHTYNTFGTFTVVLKGELLYGCTTYDTLTIVVLNNVGVNENDVFSSKIKVYPNPVKDEFSLAFDFGVSTDVQIQLFSANGELLQEEKKKVANEVISFNGINYEKGVYFLYIKSNNNMAVRRLVIIE